MTDYNGWVNYETWRVHLDLTNNGEEIYNRFCAFMDGHIAAKESKANIAKRLEQWALDLYFPIRHIYRFNHRDEYMLAYDIMQRFFLCVDWMEIVESYWADVDYINSLTEKPKTYYAVNFNPVGYLPESEPYEGLENIDEIIDAIDDICYQFEYRFDLDAWNELPEKRDIRETLTKLIDKNQLEHETIGYIGDYCIFVYKDDEYEYRQSK